MADEHSPENCCQGTDEKCDISHEYVEQQFKAEMEVLRKHTPGNGRRYSTSSGTSAREKPGQHRNKGHTGSTAQRINPAENQEGQGNWK